VGVALDAGSVLACGGKTDASTFAGVGNRGAGRKSAASQAEMEVNRGVHHL
jgi:hypothetical protein